MNLADLVKTTRYPKWGLGVVVKKNIIKDASKIWYKVQWASGDCQLHEEEDLVIVKKSNKNVKKR